MGNECCDGRREYNQADAANMDVSSRGRQQPFDQFENQTSSRKNLNQDSLHGINYDQVGNYQSNDPNNSQGQQSLHNIFGNTQLHQNNNKKYTNDQTYNNNHNNQQQQQGLVRQNTPFNNFQSSQKQKIIVQQSGDQVINAESFQKENDVDDQQKFQQNKNTKTSNIFLQDNDLAQLKQITESQFQNQNFNESDFKTFTYNDNQDSNRGQIRMSNFEQLPNDSQTQINYGNDSLEPIKESTEIKINNEMVQSYVGERLNGKPHGKGKLIFQNGDIYEGELYNGQMQGYGKLEKPSQYIYEGYFMDDKFEGKGKKIYQDGRIHEGEFKAGKEQGVGVLTGPDQKTISKGIWINGVLQG